MKLLKDILYKVAITEVYGSTDMFINDVTFSTDAVAESDVFVAIKGLKFDGHSFIESAIKQGCAAVICESLPVNIVKGITYVKVKSSREALAYMSANFFNNPSERIKLIGVTGTNGKTTTVSLLHNLFAESGKKCGLISTVGILIGNKKIEATHTTPDAYQLNKLLNDMVVDGCEYCFMEVSSHAVVQHRVTGIHFTGGVFTNITHDHLDFHITFAEYLKAKKGFFDMLPETAFAIVNNDDKNGLVMLQNCRARKITYSIRTDSNFKCRIIENSFGGLMLQIKHHEILFRLIGSFNAYNITSVFAVAMELGLDEMTTLIILSKLSAPEGRLQYTISANKVTGIVDYAHTPDALENVLSTIKDIRNGNEKIITVVGCGGDRDAAKRPLMARIACDFSDKVILTSDNPRSEDPNDILKQMQEGVPVKHAKKTLSIADRGEAIKAACSMATKGDIILIAGKGHEKYQEIKGVKNPFDDMQVLVESLNLFEN
nr:UDP-N-acetylmuramoyl-L-alanyl-D-glutamate--2,6-diaminopimelate ligase [Bacteroidota bacterium]